MGIKDSIDDFLLHSSANTLQLCAFATLLIFPGSAGLLIVGGAFLADSNLRDRYAWLLPCSIVMLSLGAGLLITGCAVIVKICRSHQRERHLRASASEAEPGQPQRQFEEQMRWYLYSRTPTNAAYV